MKKLAALVAVLIALALPAHATTFYSGMDAALTDSSLKSVTLSLDRPAFGDSTYHPLTGAKLKRVTGVTGQTIPGTTGGATWGARSRHHYSKDQPWSADEKYYWIQQKSGTPGKIVFDSLGAVKWMDKSALSHYCACLDSSEEIRMHPAFPNFVIGFVKDYGGTAYNKLIWWTLDSCLTKRSWVIPIGFRGAGSVTRDSNDLASPGLQGEGTPSDDGRWISISTHYDRSTADKAAAFANRTDSIVVVDMMNPHEVPGTGTRGGRVGTAYAVPRLPWENSTNGNGSLGHQSISAKGAYVHAAWEGAPAYGRVFHRGNAAGADTSLLTLFPHTMAARGLRFGTVKDSTLGWVASLSHADFNTTTSGVEVVVGGMRPSNLTSSVSDLWCEMSITGASCSPRADRDSGTVIMVELATGLHRHLGHGSKYTGHTSHGDNHTSGRATGMRGWHLLTFASLLEGDPTRQYADELVMMKLDGDFASTPPSGAVIRYGTTHTDDKTEGTVVKKYDGEGHGVPSPTGRRVMFNSRWTEACTSCGTTGDTKSYVYDIRTTGRRDFYVKAGADTGRTGLSANYPSGSFAKVNRLGSAHNGSHIVVHVQAHGTPIPDFPNPHHAPLGGKRYYVYGKIADPDAATIAGSGVTATLSQSNVSLRGVKIAAELKLVSPATFDSITHFTLGDRLSILGADRSVIADGTVSGPSLELGAYNAAVTDARATADTVLRVRFTNLTAAGGQTPIRMGSSSPARWVDSLHYEGNQHTVVNTGTVASWANDHVMRSAFVGNKFSIRQTQTPTDPSVFFRDSSTANLFRRDTVLAYGEGVQQIAMGYNGIGGAAALQNTSRNSTIDSCYFLTRNGTALSFPNHHVRGWNIKRSAVISSGAQATRIGNSTSNRGFLGKNYLDHNTLASDWKATGPNALREMGVAGFDGMKTADDSVRFTNNLIYSMRPGGVTTDSVSGAGFYLVDSDTTNGNVSKARRFLISNWNAYAVYPYQHVQADKAISFVRSSGLAYAAPGGSTAWNTLLPGRDVASVYGSPGFDRGGPDSTFGLTTTGGGTAFDPAISELSIAAGKDSSGADIGAIAAPPVARLVQSGYDFYLPIPASGAADTLNVYLHNTGNATMTFITSDPCQGPLGGPAQPTVAFQITGSGAPGTAALMQIIVTGVANATRMICVLNFRTNEPGNPMRYVQLNIGYTPGGGGTKREYEP